LNKMELYVHFSLYFYELFLKNKFNHLSSEVFATKQANVARNDLKLFFWNSVSAKYFLLYKIGQAIFLVYFPYNSKFSELYDIELSCDYVHIR
jgi:hypothetical protein